MFSDEFLETLGSWQKGWRENQDVRRLLAGKLEETSSNLSEEFKKVDEICYRKRFLHRGELFEIIMVDEKNEGLVSWTIDKEYAEMFKGLHKSDAVSVAIFEHLPKNDEVIVNIRSLWKSSEFVRAVNSYKIKKGKNSDAIMNFKDSQGEVILRSPLKGSEIIALTGASSPFDELCHEGNILKKERDDIYKKLVNLGNFPGVLKYTSKEGTQRIIQNIIKIMEDRIASVQ